MTGRWIALAFAVALALAVCSISGATSGPPTLHELERYQHTSKTVPGLRWRLLPSPDDPRTAPSSAQCVAIWNASVPLPTRRYLTSLVARRADVTLEKDLVQKIGDGATWTQYACAFGVAVGPRSLVVAFATPRGVSYPWRGQLNVYTNSAALTRLVARFNATVKRDGSLALR